MSSLKRLTSAALKLVLKLNTMHQPYPDQSQSHRAHDVLVAIAIALASTVKDTPTSLLGATIPVKKSSISR